MSSLFWAAGFNRTSAGSWRRYKNFSRWSQRRDRCASTAAGLIGRLFDPKRGHAPTGGDEDDVEHDVAPRTEKVAFVCAVKVGEEEGQCAKRQPPGSRDSG